MRLDEAYANLHIVQDFIPSKNSNRPGTKFSATSVTIHNTDNTAAGANAAAHAKYQKGADARKRKVSWHFTVDDKGVFQSLPINEVGWHSGTAKGNRTSIGVEICMNADLDAPAAYERAALLTAVLAFQQGFKVPSQIFQHHDWSGKNCPRVLRAQPHGWQEFLDQVARYKKDLTNVPAASIKLSKAADHHLTADSAKGVAPAQQVPVKHLVSGASVPSSLRARVVPALNLVADAFNIDPAAIAGMIHTESVWDSKNVTGKYIGLTQVGPEIPKLLGLSRTGFLALPPEKQIEAYGRWLDYYKFKPQMAKYKIAVGALPLGRQAAVLQAMQFAPNAKAWKAALSKGNFSVRSTPTKQAAFLGDTSIGDMEKYYTGFFKKKPPKYA